ncbi:right-handed parallel beta-helix repeat-containing protein [Catenovulum adriaticum]|uniref:Right handed beta helix domain-containing protein n=1 Tax=Catenovulum adriaticum TaxID=2984846 RepID=A0ABY7AS04_9ALTE|nr:right-handed parallel beta-helix repeat-containing protein [Catenovulum sp. TS8]WAJ71275.1 hypothetical protein OLW01_05620 [Catenovulum sp. TS8]
MTYSFQKKLIALTASLLIAAPSISAPFTQGGTWYWDDADRHDTNGSYPNDDGVVRTQQAPTLGSDNERNNIRNKFDSAGVPWVEVINTPYFLGNNAPFGNQIATMNAVENTADALANRPESGPDEWQRAVNPITVLWGPVQLDNARQEIADDIERTFVFRGNWNIDAPIYVGSNKTIWIDGDLTYTGADTPHVGGAAYTPKGSKMHGVFTVRRKASAWDANRGNIGENDWTSLGQNYAEPPNIVELNKPLKESIENQPIVQNVTFLGSQRGKIKVELSTAQSNPDGNWARYDPDLKPRNSNGTLANTGQVIPRTNGIHFDHARNVVVDGVRLEGALNAIYVSGTFQVDIKNNFIDKSVFRGVHLHGSGHAADNLAFVRNNLITRNHWDGIDIDSHSARYQVEENVIIGADNRFLIWTEIDAHHNLINDNVGIINLTQHSPIGAGGFQENGTEMNIGAQGTRWNTWQNNNIFNALEAKQGFLMRGTESNRVVQQDNVTWFNNYVWQQKRSMTTSNPKMDGIVDDVMYLWLNNDGNP